MRTPITLPLGANRVSWALIAVNHEPRYTAAAAADGLGVSYVARTTAASPPRGPVRGGLHGKSMHLAANRGRVCVRGFVRAMGRIPRPAVAAVGASKGCARALEVLRKSGQDP